MITKDSIKQFSFTYLGNDCSDLSDEFPIRTSITKQIDVDQDATWDVVLVPFLEFLGHCWGYDIKDKVQWKVFADRLQELRDAGLLEDEDEDIKGW